MSLVLRRTLLALTAGALFGVGLGVSGMTRPTKVLGFLDVAGDWDPTLLCVMAAAVGVHFVAYRWARRLPAPRFDERFFVPSAAPIDARTSAGALLFGVGWGLAGYCPGPAIVSLATLSGPVLLFVACMLLGMALVHPLLSTSSD